MNPVLLIPALGCLAPLDVVAPHIEYGPLMPVFALMAGACLAVLVEAFVPRSGRRPTQIILTVAALAVAIASTLTTIAKGTRIVAGQGTLALDGPTLATWMVLLVTSLGALRRASGWYPDGLRGERLVGAWISAGGQGRAGAS